jgi:flagellar biosynthesis protein FlhA
MSDSQSKAEVIKNAVVPLSLIGILVILLLPMPTPLLDVCIALNVTLSLVVLFASLYMERPLQFSAFPAILLITTLFPSRVKALF